MTETADDAAPAVADQQTAALRHLERLPSSRRPSCWDRPPPPHDWRWVVGTVGKVLIVTGLLMFAFVAYQLWGTGLEYSQAQNRLDDEFEELLAAVPSTTAAPSTTRATSPPTTAVTPTTTTTTTTPPPTVPEFAAGDVMARIEIPGIGLDAKVVSGVAPDDLKAGPGHYPNTPMPGQLGNAAIAGHRTTYGQPFFRLDEIVPGDEIVLTTVQGRFVYRMTASEIVGADRSDVVATTDPGVAVLTLTTCHPRYTAAQRLIVSAQLDTEASAAPQPAVITADAAPTEGLPPGTVPDEPVVSTPTTTGAPAVTAPVPVAVGAETADAFAHGWFSDGAAIPQVLLWGVVLTAITIGAYLLARRTRNSWIGVVVGAVPFVVGLYFFFQNVNRLMPAAL